MNCRADQEGVSLSLGALQFQGRLQLETCVSDGRFGAIGAEANICAWPRLVIDVLDNSHVRFAIHKAARCA